MKTTKGPARPAPGKSIGPSKTTTPSDPLSVLNRIKLAFLDDYVCEKRGYDPYDTSRGRAPDIWAAKRKRA